MSNSNLFFTLNAIIWPALGIFEVIVVIIAYNRYRNGPTGLLLAGGVIGMIAALSYPLLSFSTYYTGGATQLVYSMLDVISLVGSILFFVGLLQLVNYLYALKTGEEQMAEDF
ncbi:MAG: hypothetical protein AAF597_07045 [Bacteroidota bacterium]